MTCTPRYKPTSRLLGFLRLPALVLALWAPGSAAEITPGSEDLGAIWFVGDSITQSNADGDRRGSPRQALHDLLVKADYRFSYTGHFVANPEGLPVTGDQPVDNLYHYHTGVSGILIGEVDGDSGITPNLAAWWNQGRLAVVKPNVILIMIGSNDTGRSYDVPHAPSRLRALLQTIYDRPEVGNPTVFLASIPPNRRKPAQTANVASLNAHVPGIVADFKLAGKDIHFVDQFTALNTDYTANMRRDNLHPNARGNKTMAGQWFEAIVSVANPQAPTHPEAK